MSQENIELVRSMVEPFDGIDGTKVDWDADEIRELVKRNHTPDVELRPLESGAGSGPSALYQGWDGLIAYLREWLEPFSEYRLEALDYIDAGDYVLVPTRQWGVGSASGLRAEIELTFVYELRDGKIARITQYDTLDDAREAAGVGD
jgi:ketosteroid isomerase-like protein